MEARTERRVTDEALPLLERQLERMRGMLYAYYDQFYRFVNLYLLALLALAVLSLIDPLRRAILLAPFLLIYIGMHSAYLYSYVIFARSYATAIEQALNRHFGERYLVAHELEAAYIFPLAARRFVAWSPRNPASFLSAETAQFTLGGGAFFVVLATWAVRVAWGIGAGWGVLYALALGLWGAANGAYLLWYYFRSNYEQRLRVILTARYGVDFAEPTAFTDTV